MVETIKKRVEIELELQDEGVQKEAGERAKKEAKPDEQLDTTEVSGQLEGMISGSVADAGLTMGLLSNPRGFIATTIASKIPIIGAAIAAVMLAPEVVRFFIDELTRPGGVFDKRFKRILSLEQNKFITRDEKRRRELGLDQVIFSQQKNWSGIAGGEVYNNLKNRNDNRTLANEIGVEYYANGGH